GLRELARAAMPGQPGMAPGLVASHFFEAPKMTYAYGTHVGVVEVDTDTGHVAIRRYGIAYDVGKAINPLIVDGQLVGALGQGIGGGPLGGPGYVGRGQLLAPTVLGHFMSTAT